MNTEIKANNYEPKANDALCLCIRQLHMTGKNHVKSQDSKLITHTIKSVVKNNDDGTYDVILMNGKMANIRNDIYGTDLSIIKSNRSYPYHYYYDFARTYAVISVNNDTMKTAWYK